jgi:hypothetical protein
MSRALTLLALASAALAADAIKRQAEPTVTMFAPLMDQQDLVASVIDARPRATTFAVGCRDPDAVECGLGSESQTITQGPSTFAMTYSYSGGQNIGEYVQIMDCEMDFKASSATCVVSNSQQDESTTMQATNTGTVAIESEMMVTVAVTANADLLTVPPAGTTITTALGPQGTPKDLDAQAPGDDDSAASTLSQNVILSGAAVVLGVFMVL